MQLTVSPQHLQFPQQCCRCGGPPRAEAQVNVITNSYDHFASKKWFDCDVFLPICGRCRIRRWLLAVLIFAFGISAFMVAVGLILWAAIRNISRGGSGSSTRVIIVPITVIFTWAMFRLAGKVARTFDTWTLGVRIHSINHVGKTITLRFEDSKFGCEVRRLTGEQNCLQL